MPHTNRLAHESSPYLLQHAHNPVDWWPWGEAAIAEARRRDVPIFLSIGYSTCYWCHVMERECFENEAIARRMNDGLVNIKLDREERPDLDDLYMVAVQMLTGHGGWPMSVFLDPHSLKPFWGGTYFPPEPARSMPGFGQVLESMGRAYREQRDEVTKQSEAIAGAVRERLGQRQAPVVVGAEQVAMAVQSLLTIFDRQDGGFGRAPKFPQPVYLEFLLGAREVVDTSTREAIDGSLRLTLDRMAIGGMFDQVGGGFHRYSVDAYWLVPHFEKMLYDQAQLLSVYARAATVFGDTWYGRVARRIADYVLAEMTSAEGAFYSAQDAEVDGMEGKNYLWAPEEITSALGPADAKLALDLYGVNAGPNFQDPHHPHAPQRNVLRLEDRPDRLAAKLRVSEAELQASLDRINAALLATRGARKQPRLDDKSIVSWNGMMIAALAKAGRLLNERRYVDAAERAARFIEGLRRTDGLVRVHRGGRGQIPALLEDHAALAEAYVELHGAGAEVPSGESWLDRAVATVTRECQPFEDGAGGYFDVRAEQSDLFVRAKSSYDGAMPSASSVMLNAVIELARATGDRAHLARARTVLASMSSAIAESPLAAVNSTLGLLKLLRIEGSGLETSLRELGATAPKAEATASDAVEVYASAEQVELEPGMPIELTLRLKIPESYHINAADAAEAAGGALVPLHVGVTGGTGLAVYCDYPRGESIEGSHHHIHHGEVDLQVALELAGEWKGEPRLVVSYQLCSDRACLAPAATVLDVKIGRA
ncbi:MAG: thioredoxin domain-containing protein [Phycisphaerales bacterium]